MEFDPNNLRITVHLCEAAFYESSHTLTVELFYNDVKVSGDMVYIPDPTSKDRGDF